MEILGGQRVGIVTELPVLDGNGDPVLTDLLEPRTTATVAWVDNCLFEIQTGGSPSASEQQTATETTTSETAWAFLPVANGAVPAVTDGGAETTIAVSAITSRAVLRCLGNDYQMRGAAALEVDIDGIENHVFCLAERQTG